MTSGLFVTGTDTNVGKTLMACGLARLWLRQGHRVGVMKPLATGDQRDAQALRIASGSDQPLDLINPQFFRAPMAPYVAAALEHRVVQWRAIDRAFRRLRQCSDRMIVEGVGGVLVPIDSRRDGSDLIRRFGYPVVVIARAALGTLNHTLLTLEALRKRKLAVSGVLLSGGTGRTPLEKSNLRVLRERAGVPVLGQIPMNSRYRRDINALASSLARLPLLRTLLGVR